MTFKLLGTTTSPYVRKVRIVLEEKKIEYNFLLEDLSDPDSTLSQFNPLGKVPCLILEDNKTLYDSSVIVDYLDSVKTFNKLLPSNERQRAEVKCWEALADGLMDAAVLVRQEETKRTLEQRSTTWTQHQLGKVKTGLKAMSAQLMNNTYCYNNTFSLADIAVGCALGWLSFRFGHINWQTEYKNLAKLFERLSERISFQKTHPI